MQELKNIVDTFVEELEGYELDVMLDDIPWSVSPHIDGIRTYAQDGWMISKGYDNQDNVFTDVEIKCSIIATWRKYPLEVSLDLGLYDSVRDYRRGLGEVVLLVDKMEGDWTYLSCIVQSVIDAYRSALEDVEW